MSARLRSQAFSRQRRRAREGRLAGSIHYGINGDHLFEVGFENYPLPLLIDRQRVDELKMLIADWEQRAAADDARGTRLWERSESLGRL